MAHDASDAMDTKNPAGRLGRATRGTDNFQDVLHSNTTSILPILNGKMLNINMV